MARALLRSTPQGSATASADDESADSEPPPPSTPPPRAAPPPQKQPDSRAPAAASAAAPALVQAAGASKNAALEARTRAAAAQWSAAGALMAREATTADLGALPGLDPARLDVVVVAAPGGPAAARMRAHAGAAPFLAVDSEGTYDENSRRDRMCLLTVMAPACDGFDKGALAG